MVNCTSREWWLFKSRKTETKHKSLKLIISFSTNNSPNLFSYGFLKWRWKFACAPIKKITLVGGKQQAEIATCPPITTLSSGVKRTFTFFFFLSWTHALLSGAIFLSYAIKYKPMDCWPKDGSNLGSVLRGMNPILPHPPSFPQVGKWT